MTKTNTFINSDQTHLSFPLNKKNKNCTMKNKVFYSKGDHSDNLQKGSCYLEVPGDGVNGDDPLPGKVLKRSCQESLREEESGDPVHLQPNIKLKSKLSCTLK